MQISARIDPQRANDSSFSGDRILVNKFAYQFGDPERWDVIVFKFPGNAKQNYIKRLVGLPNETLKVRGGDVFAKSRDGDDFEILRKPPKTMLTMLQPVHDTQHISELLVKADWPSSWFSTDDQWQGDENRSSYTVKAGEQTTWLNYRHMPPSSADWNYVSQERLPPGIRDRKGQLITDFYAYNAYRQAIRTELEPNYSQLQRKKEYLASLERARRVGTHWVGDLACECTAKVEGGDGQILLRLIEGGHQFQCEIELTTGVARISIDDGTRPFDSVAAVDGKAPTELTGSTDVKGRGTHRLRFANVDDQLRLWVNNELVKFEANGKEHPATYAGIDPRPSYSVDDPGDLYPARIGCRNATVKLSQLRILRDIYYVAVKQSGEGDYVNNVSPNQLAKVFSTPETWADSELFSFADSAASNGRGKRSVEFVMGEEQYFPMGDNSPQSRDARLWANGQRSLHLPGLIEPGSYIDRDLLIGKAFLIYWPHAWYPGNIKTPVPFIPNIGAMGRIR